MPKKAQEKPHPGKTETELTKLINLVINTLAKTSKDPEVT